MIELREVGRRCRRRAECRWLRRRKVRAVAQLGRAPASGAGGPGFKSLQPDVLPPVLSEWPPIDTDQTQMKKRRALFICLNPSLSVAQIDERLRSHHHRDHGIQHRVFPRGHPDALAAVRPDRARPRLEPRQDARDHGARGERTCLLHRPARFHRGLARDRSERSHWHCGSLGSRAAR